MKLLKKNRGTGQGKGLGVGEGLGKNKGGGYSVGGYCVCAKCGAKVQHEQGIKCTTQKCPDCGHIMVREALLHEKLSKD
ncbi:hypothetical protein EV196_110126 [Mariniflexile fucanivorans]|uniref:Ferredoxin n=1 Tax=Mariniflexile fucanivorans TaxID=264023 RepID=A0A4R1RBK6_9FLAO|nr:hypothetical protein [Mariniflexile fucanivorans]TCL63173.1 hypothetical protein EV196_110126 [Mariniflexile fucanivorans]